MTGTRDLAPLDTNPGSRSGGYDNHQKQRFLGTAADDPNISQGSLNSNQEAGRSGRDLDQMRDLNIRDKPRTNGGGGGKSGTQRICHACKNPLNGQFVRALGATFHLECFKCRVSTRGDLTARIC